MQASSLPTKFATPFASGAGSGFIRPVPQASQQSITPGAASLVDGFPPLCFLPVGSGGIPPAGVDFNGILNQISAWNRVQAAGQLTTFDSAFSAAIGGYPTGALLASTTAGNLWFSIVDNNTTNPDAPGAAGWVSPTSVAATTVVSGLRTSVPIYPEIQNAGNAFTFTAGSGTVSIDAGQTFAHRGVYQENTSNYATGARTFGTTANKTYHFRWRYNAGSPAFGLYDLSNAGYNPSSLAENNAAFDTTYDDICGAKIVTDASNNITVLPLKNRASLLVNSTISANSLTRFTDSSGLFIIPFATLPLNWARRPASFVVTASLVSASGTTSTYLETITYYSGTFTDGSGTAVASLDRYGMTAVGVMQTRVASSSITGSWTSIQTGSA